MHLNYSHFFSDSSINNFSFKSKTTRFKIYDINKICVVKLIYQQAPFLRLILKSLYAIKFEDLTCPLAKPERSRVQSLLKLSADTDPYC